MAIGYRLNGELAYLPLTMQQLYKLRNKVPPTYAAESLSRILAYQVTASCTTGTSITIITESGTSSFYSVRRLGLDIFSLIMNAITITLLLGKQPFLESLAASFMLNDSLLCFQRFWLHHSCSMTVCSIFDNIKFVYSLLKML